MLPNATGEIPNLPKINNKFKTAQVCSENQNTTLILLGRLCDDNCLALADKHKLIVYKNQEPIIKAARYRRIGMYLVNLNNPINLANSATLTTASKVV